MCLWRYLTRHLHTIKKDNALRKINFHLCEGSSFLWVPVFLNINCHACRGTQTFGLYKYLTPVCQCSHAENPQRQADGWTVSHWVSLVEGLNEYAGSAEVEHGQRQVGHSSCSPHSTWCRGPKGSSKWETPAVLCGSYSVLWVSVTLSTFLCCFSPLTVSNWKDPMSLWRATAQWSYA